MIERLAVIRVRARREQHPRQLRVVIDPSGPVQRRGLPCLGRGVCATAPFLVLTCIRVRSGIKQECRHPVQPVPVLWQGEQARMGGRDQRRQGERAAGTFHPGWILGEFPAENLTLSRGAGEPGIMPGDFRVFGQKPGRRVRPRPVHAARDLPRIDKAAKSGGQRLCIAVPQPHDLDKGAEIGPGGEAVFAGDTGLRVMQAQLHCPQCLGRFPAR